MEVVGELTRIARTGPAALSILAMVHRLAGLPWPLHTLEGRLAWRAMCRALPARPHRKRGLSRGHCFGQRRNPASQAGSRRHCPIATSRVSTSDARAALT